MSIEQTPFSDLPAALVEEVLNQTTVVGDLLFETFRQVKDERETRRQALSDSKMILSESTLGYPPLPTTCATDGSYAIERLLTTDLVAAAAVAVEGLTPPSEARHWEQPRHTTYVEAEVHDMDTATVLRAVMLGNELLLATRAPHDLVMLDFTLTLPIIYFNQAFTKAPDLPSLKCSKEFLNNCVEYLRAYAAILQAKRSDKHYIALPKYSTRREIGDAQRWPGAHDDRGLLTLLLRPGELTKPLTIEAPKTNWHINVKGAPKHVLQEAHDLAATILESLAEIRIFYYKPQEWLPALRVEVANDIAANNHRLATVVQGLKHQCATPGMLEPYPLYLADRTVKSLARSLPAFRQIATQRIAEQYDGDIGEVFFAMHGYRSETGGK